MSYVHDSFFVDGAWLAPSAQRQRDRVGGFDEAVYGLGSAVFSPDLARAEAIALRVRAGTLNINAHITDFHVPLAGWKQSGIGQEAGPEAVDAYLQTKVIGPYR